MSDWPNQLAALLKDSGLVVSFSRWCISGLVKDCACRRCLTQAGKPWTEEAERAAEERYKVESAKFRKRIMAGLDAK